MSAPYLTITEIEDYRNKARDRYTGHGGDFSDGDIDIDVDAVVSHSDEGAYVAAWVWVPRNEEA
jgi:hypothetical protein